MLSRIINRRVSSSVLFSTHNTHSKNQASLKHTQFYTSSFSCLLLALNFLRCRRERYACWRFSVSVYSLRKRKLQLSYLFYFSVELALWNNNWLVIRNMSHPKELFFFPLERNMIPWLLLCFTAGQQGSPVCRSVCQYHLVWILKVFCQRRYTYSLSSYCKFLSVQLLGFSISTTYFCFWNVTLCLSLMILN